ncbi:Agenet domain-containing protein/bromo-adjacent-like proteiny (BAH) domain-containing protein [Abeliophyllum distichum]|uniref:Agenet domain-containing protein/bromo-adjacent-like proteiny (BAH) domain-containing protein n=1 Tax=Abeliophyllum distichum TaxID=126358 RepID=A0ABD1PT80_9LAMI
MEGRDHPSVIANMGNFFPLFAAKPGFASRREGILGRRRPERGEISSLLLEFLGFISLCDFAFHEFRMAADKVLMGWEERVIRQENGKRLVHYYVRDTTGNSVLAVVGTYRSLGHMIYSVTEDFIRVFGFTRTVHSGTKWLTRREVVNWLVSVTSRGGPIANSNLHANQTVKAVKSLNFSMTRFSSRRIQTSSVVENSDIVWTGNAWNCNKQLKHFPSFCRCETDISVYSFVVITSEEENDHIGYLEDLYEDGEGEKMAKVRWINYTEEIDGLIPQLDPHPREVFITPYEQEIRAECIDGIAAVLTPNHLEECLTLPLNLSFDIFMCHREFKNGKVKPFSLTKLRGYSNQPILFFLDSHVPQQRNEGHKSTQVEDSSHEDPAKKVPKRVRSSRNQNLEIGYFGGDAMISDSQVPKRRRTKVKITMSGKNLIGPEPPSREWSEVNQNIELLCEDSGMRDCWFRCKVLKSSTKLLKVQYYDIPAENRAGKLEEWFPKSKVAAADKLGMRCAGRPAIRPWPSVNSSDLPLKVGVAIDAWQCDHWREGVVTGFDTFTKDNLHVYFPGDNRFSAVERKNIRVSREWIGDKWVDIEGKPDILSFLSSNFSPKVNLPPLPACSAFSCFG